jgi:hypothetical protein
LALLFLEQLDRGAQMLLRVLVVASLHLDEPEQELRLRVGLVEIDRFSQVLDSARGLPFIPKAGSQLELAV